MNGYAVVSVVALGLAGCSGNPHLTREHGRSYRAFLERQAFHRAAATPPYQEAEKGLDAQEAAIVARSYRQGLAPKDAAAAGGAPGAPRGAADEPRRAVRRSRRPCRRIEEVAMSEA